jgi:hypothetical protein
MKPTPARNALWALITVVAFACNSNKTEPLMLDSEQALVSYDGKKLTKAQLQTVIPPGSTSEDSAKIAEEYIQTWLKAQVMYDKARKNVNNTQQIDELIENYRQSLTVFSYQQQLVEEQLGKETDDNALKQYYNQHADEFTATQTLIKGIFLAAPSGSSSATVFRKNYRTLSEEALNNINKQVGQKGVIIDNFYDRWTPLADVLEKIPHKKINGVDRLKEKRILDVSDEDFVYLLNVKDYIEKGEKAPFESAKEQIRETIVKDKRTQYIKEVEDNLLKQAEKDGKITYHYK